MSRQEHGRAVSRPIGLEGWLSRTVIIPINLGVAIRTIDTGWDMDHRVSIAGPASSNRHDGIFVAQFFNEKHIRLTLHNDNRNLKALSF